MIAHVVLFEPKPGLSPEQRRAFLESIRSTARNTGVVDSAYVGRPLSTTFAPSNETGQKTYSLSAVLTFSNEQALGTYLQHPAHESLRTLFWQFCEATLIADLDLSDVNGSDADLLV